VFTVLSRRNQVYKSDYCRTWVAQCMQLIQVIVHLRSLLTHLCLCTFVCVFFFFNFYGSEERQGLPCMLLIYFQVPWLNPYIRHQKSTSKRKKNIFLTLTTLFLSGIRNDKIVFWSLVSIRPFPNEEIRNTKLLNFLKI
jgi:hypothetical protein